MDYLTVYLSKLSKMLVDKIVSRRRPIYVSQGVIIFDIYDRVTHHIVSNLQLTSKQKFRFSMSPMY